MPDNLVKVHDVAQEYWYIRRTHCSCGGTFQTQMQMLQYRDGTPVDRLVTKCDKCGNAREFLFDISAFHGVAIMVERMHLDKVAAGVTDEQVKAKVLSLCGSPAAQVVQTILDLGKAGDSLALDWLEDAIRHARSPRSGA
jgi:hypothetical protein